MLKGKSNPSNIERNVFSTIAFIIELATCLSAITSVDNGSRK